MSVLLTATVILFCFNGFALSELYHISPSVAGPCPTVNCITFSQFADNIGVNRQLDSIVTLFFESGKHSLISDFLIENITDFSMLSNYNSTTISCEQSASWSFFLLSHVQISGLTFIECSFKVHSVAAFTVKNSAFSNHTGNSAINIFDSSAYIIDSYFQSNSGGMLKSKLHEYENVGSGAVFLVSQSNIEFSGSSFEGNNAEVGGVIFTELHSNISFSDCYFTENHATIDGGVMYSDERCTITAYNCTFLNNSALHNGGVFMLTRSNLSIYGSLFAFSEAKRGCGGAISAKRDLVTDNMEEWLKNRVTLTLVLIIKDNSYFEYNNAMRNGGAVYCDTSLLEIDDSVFSNNTVEWHQGGGGAIYTASNKLSILSTLFFANRAIIGGALEINYVGTTYIINSNFLNNLAEKAGGAIVSEVKSNINIYLFTCTFIGNFAQTGGVIYTGDHASVNGSNISLKNNTASQGIMYFTKSSATFKGNNVIINNLGSLYFYYSSVVFKGNTIIANNVPYTTQSAIISSEGGGITAFHSNVDFHGTVNFTRNFAKNGGAISSV